MSSKQIRVGQRWRRRDGSVVELTAVHPTGEAFADKDCHWYDGDDGRMFSIGGRDKDLVELIEDAPGEPQASTPFAVGMEGVKTRDGRKVRILCVDMASDRPVIVATMLRDGCEMLYSYYSNGRYNIGDAPHSCDILPPAPPKQYVWMNVYEADDGTLKSRQMSYPSKESADKMAVSGRVGRMNVELEARWDE